ncbi:MAG TPA: hypothetical protein VFC76_08835 [Oscillospiraceae bacterium]|nr:hypothetical protein [Oscillospiraceae bacterium]
MKNTIRIILLAIVILVVSITVVSCKKPGGGVPVTDEHGNPITDVNGEVITVVPETVYETVTDDNGMAVTDKNGKALTTVVYKDVNVAIPVTDKDGKAVTDKNGSPVTETIVIKPTYPKEPAKSSGKPGTTSKINVPLTDGEGNTQTDKHGNVITYTKIESDPAPTSPIITKTSWKRTFGGALQDYVSSVAPTSDGGCIALVVTNSTDADLKGLMDKYSTPATAVVKYDKDGNVVWKKVIGGAGVIALTTVEVAKDDSIYAAGYSTVPGDSQKRQGSYDAVVYKLNENGKKLWARSFGTSTTDMFIDIAVLDDLSVVCVGSVGTNDGDVAEFKRALTDSSCSIVKYSSSGEKVFANILGGARDRFVGICAANDGGFYVSAVIYSDFFFECKGKSDAAVIKLDSKGKKVWVTPISGSNIEYFPGITLANNGDGCVIVGRSNSVDGFFTGELSAKGEYDAYIIRVDRDGTIFWGSPFRGQYDDSFSSVVCTADGYVATGYSKSSIRDLRAVGNNGGQDIIVACFSYSGELRWTKGFGGSYDESAESICATVGGGYVCAGKTLSSDNVLADIPGQKSNGEYSVGVLFKFTK